MRKNEVKALCWNEKLSRSLNSIATALLILGVLAYVVASVNARLAGDVYAPYNWSPGIYFAFYLPAIGAALSILSQVRLNEKGAVIFFASIIFDYYVFAHYMHITG